MALEYHDIVYAAFFFGIMSVIVAGFYLLLDAPFIAMIQMAVYTGAISVLIIFGVLLIRREADKPLEPYPTAKRTLLGILIAASVVGLMALVALQFTWASKIPPGNYEQAKDLGTLAQAIWGDYVLPVELIGLALLTAMVGGIALLRREKIERIAAFRGEPEPVEEDPAGAPLLPVEEANQRRETS
ncbi:MAG: NADH-quinone oxidoreductase subunit J [Candidatus Heimdallarchaeota archaeon]